MASTQARAAIQAPPFVERLRRAARNQPRVVGVYAILLAMLIPASLLSPTFRSPTTLFNIVTQATFTAITTAGQFLVILTGGLDLSVGSVAKLSSVLSASVMDGKDANLFLAALTATAIGLAVGLVSSLVVVRLKVAPFIATFATYYIVRGGTSLFGGRGSVVGVVGGVLLLSTITSVFDILQVESLYQLLLKGLIIVVAVAIYRTRGTRDA